MDQINQGLQTTKNFLMAQYISNPPLFILVAALFAVILFLAFRGREAFEGITEGVQELASYPAIFTESVIPPFVKDMVYDNYFVKVLFLIQMNITTKRCYR